MKTKCHITYSMVIFKTFSFKNKCFFSFPIWKFAWKILHCKKTQPKSQPMKSIWILFIQTQNHSFFQFHWHIFLRKPIQSWYFRTNATNAAYKITSEKKEQFKDMSSAWAEISPFRKSAKNLRYSPKLSEKNR